MIIETTTIKEIKSLRSFQFMSEGLTPLLLNIIACLWVMPFLYKNTFFPIEVCYFLVVGLLVLVPMFFGAIYICKREGGSNKTVWQKMRIKKMTRSDWQRVSITFLAIGLSSFLISSYLIPLLNLNPQPYFFKNMPFTKSMQWIICVWPIFFFFNIVGEEFYWRGLVLPKLEKLPGKLAWLINGFFWFVWHLPLGINVAISSIPILFLLPYVVQKTGNSSVGIIIHSLLGAFGFLILAFGLIK
jgi:membrane protease YdiL (CAAX protease family)